MVRRTLLVTGGLIMALTGCAGPDSPSEQAPSGPEAPASSSIATPPTTSPPRPSPTSPSAPNPSPTGPSASSPGGPGRPSGTYLPDPEPELPVPGRAVGVIERVTGTIAEGQEHGCLTLTPETPGGATRGTTGLTLITDGTRVRAGQRVTLEGYRAPEMTTTCQQGTPFVIREVHPAG